MADSVRPGRRWTKRPRIELAATRARHSYMDTSYLDTMTGWVR
ncbi:hypothetical protein I553_9330 [Mycobacterium xenopi 4042]|uniref:Uncharacterized protein n=1 Tax=Mycobacterium xenopi 4042 TaxID=1299334 RepID=X8DXP0_MYCXE|nr:hypothetical protein I553_9330 [Mycobacterium xenopi 4042]